MDGSAEVRPFSSSKKKYTHSQKSFLNNKSFANLKGSLVKQWNEEDKKQYLLDGNFVVSKMAETTSFVERMKSIILSHRHILLHWIKTKYTL